MRERLKCSYALFRALQFECADRTKCSPVAFAGSGFADAYASAKFSVGTFKARGNIDCVTMCGVVEELLSTKIANQRLARIDTNSCASKPDSFWQGRPLGLCRLVHFQRACHCARCMVCLLHWRPEHHMYGAAERFVPDEREGCYQCYVNYNVGGAV